MGEGGGQILRTALSLSLLTGTPFTMRRIRAGRSRPGLRRQHVAAVHAARELGTAEVSGAKVGSGELSFRPGAVRPVDLTLDLGSAGSTSLVIQTVVWPLLFAEGPSSLRVRGGTHNPMAPPFDFLDRVFRPVLRRMGVDIELELRRPGFYPGGGGDVLVRVMPSVGLRPVALLERGALRARRAEATVANLPLHIAERELAVVASKLSWERGCLEARSVEADGPGNVLTLELAYENTTELVSTFGERGKPAERVARQAARELRKYLKTSAPVGEHLADQLLIPYALAGGGEFRTGEPSGHCRTNLEVISRFLPVAFDVRPEGETWRIEARGEPFAPHPGAAP